MQVTVKLSRILVVCLTALMVWSGCTSDPDPVKPTPQPDPEIPDGKPEELSYIFQVGDYGYNCFRIPAIVKSKDGTLLAFAEARKNNCSDEDNIDLVLKRSTDGGKSWSNLIMVWDDKDNTCGNPAPVVDAETGRIHVLMSWNLGSDKIGTINNGTSQDTRRVYYTYSDDDGKHWQMAQEITATVKRPAWGWYATGPGHGLQLSKGNYKNRLIIPCDYIEVGTGRRGFSHVIYSDDNGANWQLGGISPVHKNNPNESTAAELSDGRVMLNMRNGSNNRLVSISNDGGLNFPSIATEYALIDPSCQGSLLSTVIQQQHTLFFCNAASTQRENLTIKMSTTDGQSWNKRYTVYSGPAAYSDIVLLNEKEISVLYEAGKSRPYEGIAFKTVQLVDFK